MKQYTLNRKTYKDVKRMDHQQMDAFCKNLYKAGHADGMKDAEGLTEDEVREVILGVKGIGPKKAEDIVNALTAAQMRISLQEHSEKHSVGLPVDIHPEEKRSSICFVREVVRTCSPTLLHRQSQEQVLRCSICWKKAPSFVTIWKK